MTRDNNDMVVAKESFVTSDGAAFSANQTRVRANDPVVKKFPHLFQPLDVTYPHIEAATAAPGEVRDQPEPPARAEPKPSGLTTSSLKGG